MRVKASSGAPLCQRCIAPAAAAALLMACATSARERSHGAMLDPIGRAAPPPGPNGQGDIRDGRDLFAGAPVLERADLVDAVLERNPDVESARQAWRAALARVPQARAIDDPMLRYGIAPLSAWDDRGVPLGQTVEISQSIPLPGKRRLAGESALAEAEATRGDLEAVRLDLALAASNLYDDYYVAVRSIETSLHHGELLEQLRRSAEAQYVAGRASQQDPLQAEVELGNLEVERVALESAR
ncbi:MAG TPA: TolC family protein, partial [Kofleriaceae bacterium]|nr:TolC family protein [Kofleriaceae bacterium]